MSGSVEKFLKNLLKVFTSAADGCIVTNMNTNNTNNTNNTPLIRSAVRRSALRLAQEAGFTAEPVWREIFDGSMRDLLRAGGHAEILRIMEILSSEARFEQARAHKLASEMFMARSDGDRVGADRCEQEARYAQEDADDFRSARNLIEAWLSAEGYGPDHHGYAR